MLFFTCVLSVIFAFEILNYTWILNVNGSATDCLFFHCSFQTLREKTTLQCKLRIFKDPR